MDTRLRRRVSRRGMRGQYSLELALFFAAVALAAMAMAPYVLSAVQANRLSIESQLNGAMFSNRPSPE